jgi:hypothetical protein
VVVYFKAVFTTPSCHANALFYYFLVASLFCFYCAFSVIILCLFQYRLGVLLATLVEDQEDGSGKKEEGRRRHRNPEEGDREEEEEDEEKGVEGNHRDRPSVLGGANEEEEEEAANHRPESYYHFAEVVREDPTHAGTCRANIVVDVLNTVQQLTHLHLFSLLSVPPLKVPCLKWPPRNKTWATTIPRSLC